MDNGVVLQGLDEEWSFMGADLFEWIGGFIVFLLISLFGGGAVRSMPFMLIGWVLTTTTLAGLRRTYPDERRGLQNAMMTACGFPPRGIPSPSALQPVWSAAPVRELEEKCMFAKLGLDELFPSFRRDTLSADE